jgi:tetratricopeptide (TPR) repeat protein
MLRPGLFLLFAFASFFLLQGCSCCIYYNHMFNAERAWNEGLALQKTRLDSLPTDTTWVLLAERAKYDRVIEKCSRVLERFPDDVSSKPRAVFLIAESFRKKGEWSKAINKYDEFERYFSDHDSMPAVEYQRAFCLYKNRDFAIARFALDRIFAKGKDFLYYTESLQLMSLLEENANMPDEAIAALEKVLAGGGGTPFMRARMHLRLADLYFKQGKWGKSLEHFQAKEILGLDVRERGEAAIGAVECQVFLKQFPSAIEALERLEANPEFSKRLLDFQVRRGEVLLLAGSGDKGIGLLQKIASGNPKTLYAARAWYGMGDYEQLIRKNYPTAIVDYDSSWACWASSEWGRKSKGRRDALDQVVSLQKKGSASATGPKLTSKEEFQIAELFLFKLSEVDSAIRTLDRLVATGRDSGAGVQDPEVLARAHYARAFIYDEFKKDSVRADSLYGEIVARFPGTDFAKQSQQNLGLRVTQRNTEDSAHAAFIQAESLWVSITLVPVDSIERIDSLFAHTLRAYDSVAILFPKTQHAARALWAKAWLYENQAGQADSARVVYDLLRTQYGNTTWGKEAVEKLQPRLKVTDQELERLRRRLEQGDASNERYRKQYEEDMKKKQEADRKKLLDGPSVDEVLENDYNSLYDFQ